MYQFLIGTVQRDEVKIIRELSPQYGYQFLIGTVQQQYLLGCYLQLYSI